MSKASGGSGTGGSGGGGGGEYGSGISTSSTSGYKPSTSNFINADAGAVVNVKPVSSGASEEQKNYANSVKRDAMQAVDSKAADLARRKGAIPAKIKKFRNDTMKKINSEKDARTVLDKLKPIAKDAAALGKHYGTLP
jgi:hypothetical protein